MNNKIETFKKLVEKNPDNALVRFSLANEFYKEGLFKDSIEELKKYLSFYDDEGAGYRLLAQSYLELGDKKNAKESYIKGIKAAKRHGHPGMADEFEEAIEFID